MARTEDPGHAEAGDEKELGGQQGDAKREQEQLLPSGEPHQPVAPKERREARDPDRAGKSEARRPQLHDDPENAERHEDGAQHGMGQETHHVLGPVGRHPADFGAGQVEVRQDRLQGVGAGFGDLVLERLRHGEREKLSLAHQARDLHVGIDHRLGDRRRPAAGLGGRPELLADVGHGLLARRLAFPALAHLHRHGRPDRGAHGHDDRPGGEADQRARGDGALVHEGRRADRAPEQRVPDDHRRVHPPRDSHRAEHPHLHAADELDDARRELGALRPERLERLRRERLDAILDAEGLEQREGHGQ
jgi:hypothetical protein